MKTPHLRIEISGPVEKFTTTDVPVLQYLAKTNWELFVRATERLQRAREKRNAALQLLTRVIHSDWGGEYGPDSARLLTEIKEFLK